MDLILGYCFLTGIFNSVFWTKLLLHLETCGHALVSYYIKNVYII